MKFKSSSKCFTEITLGNSTDTIESSASSSASATSEGYSSTDAIIDSNNLSFKIAYNYAYSTAYELLYNDINLVVRDVKNTIVNNCIEYIYTLPVKVEQNKSFVLYYLSDNVNINNSFQLIYNDTVISTFSPNIILIDQNNPLAKLEYFSNVTINANDKQCFVSWNIIPNSIITVNKDKKDEYNRYLGPIAPGLKEPVGVEFDRFNNMYVANFVDSSISVYNPEKDLIAEINDPLFRNLGGLGINNQILYALNGLPIDDDNSEYNGKYIMFKIILTNNNEDKTNYKVSVFCTDTLSAPLFMCFDKFNNSYVTNFYNNTISKINMTSGEAEIYIDNTQGLLKPRGITIDKDLNLFVSNGDVETENYFILKITPNKKISTYTTLNLISPRGLAIDIEGDGSLYVANIKSRLIKIISNKYLFEIEDNILQKGNNTLTIKDITDDLIIDTFDLVIE